MMPTARTAGGERPIPAHSRSLAGILSLLLIVTGAFVGFNAGAPRAALAASSVNGNVATWTQLHPATSPEALSWFSMAFDQGSGQLILFGGDSNGIITGDTWAWNGTNWTNLNISGPPARLGASMAYDPAVGGLILFGGLTGNVAAPTPLNDCWEFKNGQWSPFPAGPTARAFASMAYDPASSQLVLFGGVGPGPVLLSDTYVLTGNVLTGFGWAQHQAVNAPSPRDLANMAYDPASGQLLLFGGNIGNNTGSGETWTWTGSGWTRLSTTGPSGRFSASMAYDPATARMVMFGGFTTTAFMGDTWTWDGSAWTSVDAITSPSPRSDAVMAFDPASGQLLLFGGGGQYQALTDTWVYQVPTAGQAWSKSSAGGPMARARASLAFDPATGQLILFGGQNTSDVGGQVATTLLDDTWVWDGTNWIGFGLSPSEHPSARAGASLAFDQATGQMLLFGGQDASGALGDLWSWNGSTWTQITPASSTNPAPRYDASMAFDPATGQLILFGGANSSGVLGDTWGWYGSSWIPSLVGPAPRSGASMAFDPASGQLVLFGGQAADGSQLTDTWTRNTNGQWNEAAPTTSPPGSATGSAMDFDAGTGQMLLFGCCQLTSNATWSWDGNTWHDLIPNPAGNPDGRPGTSLAYDPATGQVVLFGGVDVFGLSLGDTWTYAPVPQTLLTITSATGTYSGTATLSSTLTYGSSYVQGEVIHYSINGNPVCDGATGVACPTTDSRGKTTLPAVSLAGLAAGTYPSDGSCSASAGVSASFAGDAPYVATTVCLPLQVSLEHTFPAVVQASPAQPVYGQPISFTIRVFPLNYLGQLDETLQTPTGTVVKGIFASSQNANCLDACVEEIPLDSHGTATLTSTKPVQAGQMTFPRVLVYDSDNGNIASSGGHVPANIPGTSTPTLDTVGVLVNPANTTTTVSVDQSSAAPGQNVTLTATVAPAIDFTPLPGTLQPTGLVTFYDGSIDSAHQLGIGTLSTDSTSGKTTATLSIDTLSIGVHTILAAYTGGHDPTSGAGDGNYNQSTSSSGVSVDVAYATTTTLSASANPATVGKPVTYSAAISPVPNGGTVSFTDGGSTISGCGAMTPDSNGMATCTVTYSGTGAHPIKATFSGNDSYLGSSGTLTEQVDTDLSSFPKLASGAYNLTSKNLSGAYLAGANLAGANITSANLSGVNLTGANLSGANLTSANFSSANLSAANLSGANLSGANFKGASFSMANLTGANLTKTNLKGATGLKTATLAGVVWSSTTCPDNTLSIQDGGTCLAHL